MRCSDCKCFKTADCTVNPEGEDCSSAEIFACFKPSTIDTKSDDSKETAKHHVKTVAITSLTTGIISVCSSPLAFFGIPELFSLFAIISGVVGMRQSNRLGVKGYGMAMTGMILGIFSLILSIVFILLIIDAFIRWGQH